MSFSKYILLFTTFISANSYAVKLEEVLPLAYSNSEEIGVAKETFIGEIQAMSNAIAGFMPQVSASVNMQNARNTPVNPYNNTNQETATSQTLQISQPIFNGGSGLANLKSANAQFRVSRAKFYDAEQKFLLSAIQNYLDLYEAQELYNIASASLEFRKTEFNASEERFKLGLETVTGTAIAKTKLAQAEASKAAAFAKLEALKANFKDIFSIEAVDLTLPSYHENLPEDLDNFTKRAMSSNFSLAQAQNSAVAAKANSYSAAGKLLPNVNIYAQATRNTNTIANSGPSKVLATGVSVNIPILSRGGAEYADVRKANSDARGASQSLHATMSAVGVNAINIWQQYQASKISLSYSEEAVKASELALEAAKQEYLVGSKTMLDVFQLEDELNKAKTQDISIKKSYIMNIYSMQSYMGNMTAKSLNLKVKYFNPDSEFKKLKAKVVGF